MPHANEDEVEMEPLPASSPTRLPKSSSNARPAKPRAAVTALTLLKHAFGKSMLAGTDEWRDVAEVVRSSFLIVSKEIKCQDARLRVLEDNHQQQQMEREERDRWSVVHAQLKLFSDELQLLTQELQHLRDDEARRETVVQERLTAQWRAYAEYDARVKHKIAKATRAVETKASRDELQVEMLRLETRVNGQLNTQNTQFALAEHELRALGLKIHGVEARLAQLQKNEAKAAVDESVRTRDAVCKLLLVQKRCQQEIKRLQREFFATYNSHYGTAQRSKTTETMSAVSSSQKMTSTANEATCTKPAHKNIDDVGKSETERHCKSAQGRELVPPSHGGVSHNAPVPLPAVKPTHASLKQRFEDARLKQQACLTRLRQANY
ncbi:hypothetical protein FI667_g15309, partial [Globisporangium splendens]